MYFTQLIQEVQSPNLPIDFSGIGGKYLSMGVIFPPSQKRQRPQRGHGHQKQSVSLLFISGTQVNEKGFPLKPAD